MAKKGVLTKILALAGTLLVAFPILAPILLSVVFTIQSGMFRIDYLMPAELFVSVLVGGGLLLWAAFRARSQRRLIAWALGIAVLLLVGGQGLAVVTGLASGETQPGGWQMAVVLTSLGIYTLAVIATGVGGILLLRDVFGRARVPEGG
jgi:hypothetical protein